MLGEQRGRVAAGEPVLLRLPVAGVRVELVPAAGRVELRRGRADADRLVRPQRRLRRRFAVNNFRPSRRRRRSPARPPHADVRIDRSSDPSVVFFLRLTPCPFFLSLPLCRHCDPHTKPGLTEMWCHVECPIDCQISAWSAWDEAECAPCGHHSGEYGGRDALSKRNAPAGSRSETHPRGPEARRTRGVHGVQRRDAEGRAPGSFTYSPTACWQACARGIVKY